MKKSIEYGQGIVDTASSDYALLVSEYFYFTLTENWSIQGSDKAFDTVVNGKISEIFGLPVVRVPYLDNEYSVSETVEEENGKFKCVATPVDLKGVDAILFYTSLWVLVFVTKNPLVNLWKNYM